MKKILLLICTLCFCSLAKAQITFEKIIDTLGSTTAACIQETFDGGYVFCGGSSYNGNDVCIVKLDSIGTVEWAKTYSGSGMEGASYIEQTPDSGYMVNAAYNYNVYDGKNWLLRLDSNGDTLWTKLFSSGPGGTLPPETNSMASLNNTIYGLTGYYHSPSQIVSFYFMCILSNGFILSNKTYPTPFSSDARAIDKTYDNGFIMAGAAGTSSSTSDVRVIRTNAYGDTLWTKSYNISNNEAAQDVKQTADSGFIITGCALIILPSSIHYNIFLIKTNAAGDTLWTKFYIDSVTSESYSVWQTGDGGYVLTGRIVNKTQTGFNPNIWLIKTDANGDTLWTKQFGNFPTSDIGFFVRQTKDGGYIISGTGSLNGKVGAYIIKTDSMGNVNSGTGMAELNNPFVFNFYPNPSSGIFSLNVKGIPGRNSTIKIYNVANECVYSCITDNHIPAELNLSNLPNGMYAVTLQFHNKIYSRKIIIAK